MLCACAWQLSRDWHWRDKGPKRYQLHLQLTTKANLFEVALLVLFLKSISEYKVIIYKWISFKGMIQLLKYNK